MRKTEAVMAKGVNASKEWTGKAIATTVFDSTVEPFSFDGLFAKVKWKPNNAIIGLTMDGDVFGGFYSFAVIKQDTDFHDLDMFIFFETRGRCMTPQRFSVKERSKKIALVGSGRGSFRIPQFQNSATYSFETIFPVLFEMLLDLLLIASFFFETFLQFIPRLFSRPVQFSFG